MQFRKENLTKLNILDNIQIPSDIRKLPVEKLPQLCEELRTFIVNELSKNPGHLGASLGTVEMTVALHYVFNTPEDRIVWDVGHQAYGHKILTGRKDRFYTNRKHNGLCGFPTPLESPYDAFVAGHASNSISVALGMSVASLSSNNKEERKRQVVAVIGDGALSGGLAFEGLNNASEVKNNLLIILNDNHMAIDPIHGGMSQYLMSITTSQTYNKIRYEMYRFFRRIGFLNENSRGRWYRFTNKIKAFLSGQRNIFEGMNIRYFGPVDGHNVTALVRLLKDVKDFRGPKVIHLITKKGKGYKPAEEFATEWHAPGLFDAETGERIILKKDNTPPLFQDVFGHTILELAEKNDKIVGVTPAMPSGCSLSIMMKAMPQRCFDVGIAEGHAVTFSAGMAKEGKIAFCNIYSSFMQRAYDNIIHDVAILNLPVILCLDRAGIVGADGATHHGAFDIAYLRPIPNLTICSPLNESELRNMMYTAQLEGQGAWAIRYPRGKGVLIDWETPMNKIPIGKGRELRKGDETAIISFGPIGNRIIKILDEIQKEENKQFGHYDLRFVKPLDTEMLDSIAQNYQHIITIEDGVLNGGMGSAVLEYFSEKNYKNDITRLGYPDRFIEHGTPDELYAEIGLDHDNLKKIIQNH